MDRLYQMGVGSGAGSATPLIASDAVPLLSAWVSARAQSLNIRALLLKGPIASIQLLRPNVVSADVDLLVESEGTNGLIDELAQCGWYERPLVTIDTPRIIELHSITLVHDQWPIDLDIHLYWPGFLKDRRQVFNSLWEAREKYVLAETEVFGLCVEDSALVLALHALRSKHGASRNRTLDQLTETGQRRKSIDIRKLEARAQTLGAAQSAAPFLKRFGVEVPYVHDVSQELRLWRLRTSTNGNLGAWILRIESTRGPKKLVVAFLAIFLPPRQLRQLHPELPSGPWGIVVGWVRRWRTGAKALRPTLRRLTETKTSLPPDLEES